MNVAKTDDGLQITLTSREVETLALALQRATFEDTPASRQQEILDFALELAATLR